MTLYTVFFNSYGRLRSGWRFLIFWLFFIFAGFLCASAVRLVGLPLGLSSGGLLFMMVNSGISLFLALLLGWLLGRFLEGLPFKALGAAFNKYWFKHLSIGCVIGAVTIAWAVLIAVIFGNLSFHLNKDHGSSAVLVTLGVSFLIFAVAAAFEEALCRGYILQTLIRSGYAWPAIILTSLLFAAGHLANPNVDWLAFANTALAGIWFGVAYLKTRDLWLPFGMHFMWNWVQGSIFGVEVSGLKQLLQAPLLQEVDGGPALLTGADYGIEASIACTIAIIVSTAAIYLVPFLKPSDEMAELTGREQPATKNQVAMEPESQNPQSKTENL